MERVQRIINHSQYQKWAAANDEAEKDRIFCKHDMAHNLAVARIAYILWLEQQGDPAMKPLFYGAALLHDVGKGQKSRDSHLDHGAISAALARELLPQCGFTQEEQDMMIAAILFHSGNGLRQEIAGKEKKTFCEVFYLADKLSRPCWQCGAKDECYWMVKNDGLLY